MLGNNVGQKPILDLGNLILEDKLLLLQSADQELVGGPVHFEGQDLVVQQAVLGTELNQLFPKLPVILPLHVCRSFENQPATVL